MLSGVTWCSWCQQIHCARVMPVFGRHQWFTCWFVHKVCVCGTPQKHSNNAQTAEFNSSYQPRGK